MASAAYGDSPYLCVRDNFAKSEFKNQYVVQCGIDNEDICSGFSAVSHSDKAIVLAFRGSDGDSQVLGEALGALLVDFIYSNGGDNVNPYFRAAFNKIWSAGMKDDFFTLKKSYSDYELWVTGHSLGGALASIAAAIISKMRYMSSEKIKLVTFGQPRVGTDSFAAAVNRLVPHSFRVIHANDIIPHVPLKEIFSHHHHKTEVWYVNDMTVGSDYIICNHDNGMNWENILDLNIDDHFNYFNKDTRFAVNGCPGYNLYR